MDDLERLLQEERENDALLLSEEGLRGSGLLIKFQVGESVKVTSPDYCTGQVGELVVIDERYTATGEIYGVYLDAVDSTVFFSDDELEKA